MKEAEAFKRFEAAGWSKKAAGYTTLSGRVTNHLVEPLLNAAGVRMGTRFLDVATGPGIVAVAAAMRGADVLGVDIAEGMVKVAKTAHPELEFAVADVEQLELEDDSFDAVAGNFVVNHLARPEDAMRHCARVLRSGGRAAFTVWDTPAENRLMGVTAEAIAAENPEPAGNEPPPGPDPFRFADERAFERLLTGAGLDGAKVETIRFKFPAEGHDELWEGMMAGSVRTSATLLAQPPTVVGRIRERFTEAVEEYRGDDGHVHMPASVKLASAAKP